MSNTKFAILAIVLLGAILVATIGGCITRYHQIAEYNRVNSAV